MDAIYLRSRFGAELHEVEHGLVVFGIQSVSVLLPGEVDLADFLAQLHTRFSVQRHQLNGRKRRNGSDKYDVARPTVAYKSGISTFLSKKRSIIRVERIALSNVYAKD